MDVTLNSVTQHAHTHSTPNKLTNEEIDREKTVYNLINMKIRMDLGLNAIEYFIYFIFVEQINSRICLNRPHKTKKKQHVSKGKKIQIFWYPSTEILWLAHTHAHTILLRLDFVASSNDYESCICIHNSHDDVKSIRRTNKSTVNQHH